VRQGRCGFDSPVELPNFDYSGGGLVTAFFLFTGHYAIPQLTTVVNALILHTSQQIPDRAFSDEVLDPRPSSGSPRRRRPRDVMINRRHVSKISRYRAVHAKVIA